MRIHATGSLDDQFFRVLLTHIVPLALLTAFVVDGYRAGTTDPTAPTQETIGTGTTITRR